MTTGAPVVFLIGSQQNRITTGAFPGFRRENTITFVRLTTGMAGYCKTSNEHAGHAQRVDVEYRARTKFLADLCTGYAQGGEGLYRVPGTLSG